MRRSIAIRRGWSRRMRPMPAAQDKGRNRGGALVSDVRPALDQLNRVARDFDATSRSTVGSAFRCGRDAHLRMDSGSPKDPREWIRARARQPRLGAQLQRRLAASRRQPPRADRSLCAHPARLYRDLAEAGRAGRQPPSDTFWGTRYAAVSDPDGNDVGLMNPLDDIRRSWPPRGSSTGDERHASRRRRLRPAVRPGPSASAPSPRREQGRETGHPPDPMPGRPRASSVRRRSADTDTAQMLALTRWK